VAMMMAKMKIAVSISISMHPANAKETSLRMVGWREEMYWERTYRWWGHSRARAHKLVGGVLAFGLGTGLGADAGAGAGLDRTVRLRLRSIC